MKSVFLVPIYNQERQLPAFLERVRGPLACDTVLFIDDGSTDGSLNLIRESGLPYIEHGENRGVGRSMMTAADWALEHDYDVLGGIAGNGKMLPSEMPRLLGPIEDNDVDYVKGSRFLPGGDYPNLPAFRRITIPMVNAYVRLITGQRLTDSTCGYRAYRLDVLRRAEFDWHAPWLERYGFEYYLDAKVLLNSALRFQEVPVSMRYPATREGYTKIRPVVDWYTMLKPWFMARVEDQGFSPAPVVADRKKTLQCTT